jgi:signal transduction histidine kinase
MAVISHDLRTPLTSILGGLELISQGVTGQLDEIDSELAKESELELKKILSQINDLLLIEKIDSGTFELELERVSVCDFINESVKSQESALVAKAIQCEQQLNLCRELSVCASTKLLARVFDIVLNNAIQATPEKGVISITCARAESNVVIDFADTGAGIDASLLAHVFERFRVVNGKPLAGLGMPLALRICRLHSGSISIKSSGIRGTIVEIELPLV